MWASLLILIMQGKRYELHLEPHLMCVNLNIQNIKLNILRYFFPVLNIITNFTVAVIEGNLRTDKW